MAMTFEQYKELRKKGYSQEQLQKLNTENKPKGFFQKLGASLSKRKSNITGEAQNYASGSITKPEYLLRGTGQVAGAFGDVVGQAVGAAGKFAFKNFLTPETQGALKTAGTKALQSKPGQLAMGGLQAGADKYGSFAETNPRLATNLAAVGNIATVVPIGKGVGMAGKEAVNAAIDTGKATAIAAKETGKAITGSLEKNVGKAVGMTGRMRLGDVEQSIPKAVNAFRTIAKNAKNTVVKDVDGIEKAFDPVNATFSETLQALKQTKDKLYNDWTKMAKEAGEQGVTFTGDDFGRAIAELQQTTANSTSAWRNKVQSLIDDITKNYANVTPDGQVIFRDVDPADIQKFIERINVDINPMSDKAGSEVSALLSRSLREMMDKKIDSTGPGYQALRNQYAELKSIENGLINQFKKSTRGVGNGVSQWVDGFGTLDTIVGLLTARPEAALRGVGMSLLAKTMKSLRDPENALKRSFKRILEENGQKFIPKSKTFKLLNKAKGKGGMSIQDISRSGIEVSEKQWEKLNNSAFIEALNDYGKKLEQTLNKEKRSPKINLDKIDKLEDAFDDVKAAKKTKGTLSPEAAKLWSARFKKLGIDFDEYYSLPQAMGMQKNSFTKGEWGRFTGSKAKKSSDPLLQEARKYKSAEEFTNSSPSYYHVTDSANASSIEKGGFTGKVGERSMASKGDMQGGTFLYPEKESAGGFSKNFKNPATIETKVNGKIYDANRETKYGWEDNLQTQEIASDPKILAQLKKDGYVGVTSTELGTPATFVFDPSAIKTKSQLIDIWKKAQGEKYRTADPDADLLQEAKKYNSAEEFVNSFNLMKSGEVTSIGQLPISKVNKTQIRAITERGLPHTDTGLKVKDFTPGRKVTQPLEVYSKGGSYVVENGNHRLAQALANGDTHIPVVFKRGEGKTYSTHTKSQLTDLWKKATKKKGR